MSTKSKRHKRDQAVALEYNSTEELPVVTASGVGEIARQIIEVAQENKVPIHKNQELAGLLSSSPLGDSIDPATFQLVAEVISFLYHAEVEWRDEHSFLDPLLGVEVNKEQLMAKMLSIPEGEDSSAGGVRVDALVGRPDRHRRRCQEQDCEGGVEAHCQG